MAPAAMAERDGLWAGVATAATADREGWERTAATADAAEMAVGLKSTLEETSRTTSATGQGVEVACPERAACPAAADPAERAAPGHLDPVQTAIRASHPPGETMGPLARRVRAGRYGSTESGRYERARTSRARALTEENL